MFPLIGEVLVTWKLSGLLLALVLGAATQVPSLNAGASQPAAETPGTRVATGVIEGVLTVRERPPRRTASRYGGGADTRPIQTVPPLVYLQGRIGEPPAPRTDATIAQADTAFVPPLVVVPVGSTVGFPNRDPFFHNVFSYSGAGRFDLGRYPRGESKEVVLDEAGIIKVYCEVHESMRAAVVVVENRHWAQPGSDGAFRLEGVPPGTYTLVAWHADQGEVEREVRVTEGGITRVELEL